MGRHYDTKVGKFTVTPHSVRWRSPNRRHGVNLSTISGWSMCLFEVEQSKHPQAAFILSIGPIFGIVAFWRGKRLLWIG